MCIFNLLSSIRRLISVNCCALGLHKDPGGFYAQFACFFFGQSPRRRDQKAALFQSLEGSLQRVFADRIENDIHVFDDFFKRLPRDNFRLKSRISVVRQNIVSLRSQNRSLKGLQLSSLYL